MLYFTSDLHLGHENIIPFTGRPWKDAAEMGEALICNINDTVGESDQLCILGDVAYRGRTADVLPLLRRIRCRHIQLIVGNHDRDWSEDGVFERIDSYREVKYNKTKFVMCHYPIMTWNGIFQGSVHVHGHIHSAGPGYNEAQRVKGYCRYDVGVDANGYRPVSCAQIREFFKGVQIVTPAQDNENVGVGVRATLPVRSAAR